MRGHRVPDRPASTPRSRVQVPLVPDLQRASCAGHPQPWLWDATVAGETVDQRQERRTKATAICAGCPERDRCPAVVHPPGLRRARNTARPGPAAAEDDGWWPTSRACEHLGFPITRAAATRLRKRGITSKPGPGRQLLWNAAQVRGALPLQRRGRPPADTSYDEQLVRRLCAGDALPGQNAAIRGAKVESVRRLTAQGLAVQVIARRVGYSDRHVKHLRNQLGLRAEAQSA